MRLLYAFAATALLATSAPAALIYQTQDSSNVSADDSDTALSLLWNKFDTGLGSLTAVTMTITSDLTGSFTVNNNRPTGSVTVGPSASGFFFAFEAGTGHPANIEPDFVTPLGTTPVSGNIPNRTAVPASSSRVFTIDSPISLYDSGALDYFSAAAYFSSVGPATFSTDLWRVLAVTVQGSNFTLNSDDAVIGGTVTLTYEYTPNAVIPEPGTWAAAALLAGGAAFMRWRKRAKVS